MARRLAACLLNVSEGRNQKVVRDIAEAAVRNQADWVPDATLIRDSDSNNLGHDLHAVDSDNSRFKCKATVLNIFLDVEYNRSVITLAAPVEFLGNCIFQACKQAFKAIDLTRHEGGHPRLGAVDLIPIHPLSKTVSLEDCGCVARKLGKRIVEDIPNTSIFYFGEADLPEKRGLVKRRKEMDWYLGGNAVTEQLKISWDVGNNPNRQCGITGIGAIPYMTNFNITIDTTNLKIGNLIAKAIRGSSPGGLFGVQSMAFSHESKIEIACNVDSLDLQKVDSYTGPKYASFDEIETRIKGLCDEFRIKVFGSVVIGFTPEEAYERTLQNLSDGRSLDIENFDNKRM
eukprot:gene9299-16997_t